MTEAEPPAARRDEVLPTFSPRLFRWFCRYLRRYFRKHFTGVRLHRAHDGSRLEGRPVVVYTNHPSWWDPIFFMLLHAHAFPGRRLHGPMDAKALEKYRFMKKLGIFGIDLDSSGGARTFLRTSRAVLARPDAAFWITAQGRFSDVRERPVALAPGLAHLARSVPELVIQPVAVEYPFWNERHPEALAWFGEPVVPAEEPALSERLASIRDALPRDVLILAAGPGVAEIEMPFGVGRVDSYAAFADVIRHRTSRLAAG